MYDQNSYVNKSIFDQPFSGGVTIRGSVSVPVTIADLLGHQGLAVSYSNKEGTDFGSIDNIPLPSPSPAVETKNDRYYFAYTLDQYLYRPDPKSKEGFGLFGQFEMSDGNPNSLFWMAFGGIGGTGLIPGRKLDNWGFGYYYAGLSPELQDALSPAISLQDERGWEAFYNFAVTRWMTVGADVQIIKPGLSDKTAVLCGLRTVIRF